MADQYANYAALQATEVEGVDYRICITKRASPVTIVAPHGGSIEPHTSRIASALAGDSYSLYCFEGTKPGGNGALHVTSTNFDEPQCLALITASDLVVTVHGLCDDGEFVHLGGGNILLRTAIRDCLREAGFDAEVVVNGKHSGTNDANICNKGKGRAGIQFEISRGLRNSLVGPGQRRRLVTFAQATRRAIEAR